MVRIALPLIAVLALLHVAFQVGVVSADMLDTGACPNRPLHTSPVGFHFTPGLEQHQNWVEAPVLEPDATQFVLCLDGKLMAEGIGETPENGAVRASVRTTWVDIEWILGALTRYQDPRRWEIGYTTYTIENGRG